MKLTSEQIIKVHNVIHSDKIGIKFSNQIFYKRHTPITGCRYITIGNIKFIEQNPNKDSFYSKEAQRGNTITWAIPNQKGHKWGLIINNKIERDVPEVV